MSDINMHFRNIHLQSLVDQNEQLRRRVSKLTEIEGYVQLLVDKLQKAERKQHAFLSEATILRQQTRELQIKFSQSESMHGDQMRYVFSQHDKLIQEKNIQLMQLKTLLEKENSRGAQLENQFRLQKSNEQKMVAEYEEALLKYRNRVGELERDIQTIFLNLEDQKMKHAKTHDSWLAESGQFKMIVKDMQLHLGDLSQQVASLSSIKQNLEREINALVDYNQQLETKLRYLEQESSETIRRLQDGLAITQEALAKTQQALAKTQDELARKNGDCQGLQIANAGLLKDIQELKATQLLIKTDNETYITDNQRLIFLLQQSDKQNAHIREKNRELQDYSAVEIEKGKLDNLRLREQNNVLAKNNSERETYLGTKLIELKESNSARNSLEVMYGQAQGEVLSLRDQLKQVQGELIAEKKLSTELEIERKNYCEAVNLLRQQIGNLEDMNKKIQRENHQLSKENHQMGRLLSNPRQLNKDYVQQIDKMLKNFHEEREDQNKRHWVEKEKLKEMYQYEFRQKEMEMMRQLAVLQEELARATKLDILAERSITNRHTPAKTPVKGHGKN